VCVQLRCHALLLLVPEPAFFLEPEEYTSAYSCLLSWWYLLRIMVLEKLIKKIRYKQEQGMHRRHGAGANSCK